MLVLLCSLCCYRFSVNEDITETRDDFRGADLGAGGISGREDVRVVVKRPLINLLIDRPQRSDAVSRFIVVAGRVTRHVPPLAGYLPPSGNRKSPSRISAPGQG